MPPTQQYWPLVLENLKKAVPSGAFKTWFSGLEFVSTTSQGRKIILKAPSAFTKEYIERKYRGQLREAVGKYYPQVVYIDYEIEKVQESKEIELVQEEIISTPKIDIQELSEIENMQVLADFLPKRNLNNLNPKYSLETFVVNSSNELAVSVAKSVIKSPGTAYNPVFLYSSTGMGKTHLLQAIGQKMLEQRPEFKIKYTTLETFFNHFISSVEKNKGADFREYYRNVDLLLIDDIQFLKGKTATQEAFFHTFNELHQQNKQIVLASDRPPKSLAGIEDRLISRFEWGMVVDIGPATLEDRLAIFQSKLDKAGLPLTSDQVVQICQRVDSNIRDLEGVLNRLQARHQLLPNKPLVQSDIDKILSGYQFSSTVEIRLDPSIGINPEAIVQVVEQVFGVSKAEIYGDSRQKNIAMARQVAMWLCKNELDLSFPTVGKIFSGRDHSTVMHACQKLEKIKTEPRLAARISMVMDMLKKRAY